MARIKVTTRFKILEFIDRFVDDTTANAIGKAVTEEAKRNMSEGQSPVRGYGRYERYKDRTKYPGDLKEARPVNLYLSGRMLAGYNYRVKRDGVVEVGMVGGSARDKEIAQYHQDGTSVMAQRKIVPGDGEDWSVRIMRTIRDLYGKRLAKVISRANKK